MKQDIDIEPRDPEAARVRIEQTRARMSDTIDEIEDVLLQKKQDLQDRLDVRAHIRERPWQAAGLVLGAGLIVGFLTGGRSDDDIDDAVISDSRATLWEGRARRLLRIAREQEDDIEHLEAALARMEADGFDPDDHEPGYYLDGGAYARPGRFSALKETVTDHVSEFLGETVRAVLDNVRSRV